MKNVCWPYFDPEFDNLSERIYGPACRVCIDNENLDDCTVVKIDSVDKQGLLLEVVQILTDLNLTICKGYISSDAGWFMDVFHVKDENGNKLADQNVINYIEQALCTNNCFPNSAKAKATTFSNEDFEPGNFKEFHTAIELSGIDRPGLFSEISAALSDLHCNIMEAHAWSHNARLACVAYITDQSTNTPIHDPIRLASIRDHLTTVLQATTPPSPSNTMAANQGIESKTSSLLGASECTNMTSVERRLHQLMVSIADFDGPEVVSTMSSPMTPFDLKNEDKFGKKTMVSIESCAEKGYSIVNIKSKDRPRLMFDTVCTLTDMHYVVFHASVRSHEGYASQEYFIRHVDGYALSKESEKERIIKFLEAAIERRVCDGVRVELLADNRIGLLSDITRVLRENGLAVVRADIATQGGKAINVFYVRNMSGNEVDMKFVESMKKEMGPIVLQVKKENKLLRPSTLPEVRSRFSFKDLLKSQIERFSQNFVSIK